MTTPKIYARYVADDGNNYAVSIPTWESALNATAPTVATTEPPLPKGWHRRRRYVRYNDTGREQHVTILRTADANWAIARGTAVTVPEPPGSALPAAANATWEGATGEKRRKRL